MYSVWEVFWFLLISIWVGVLSFLFLKDRGTLKKLFPRTEKEDLRDKFLELLKHIEEWDRENQVVKQSLRSIAKDSLKHIQRVEILRYNPYQDTGGDQSFSMVLLDGNGDGLVLTSLHTRSGTRIYTKSLHRGKSDLDLSKEERKVIEQALQSA